MSLSQPYKNFSRLSLLLVLALFLACDSNAGKADKAYLGGQIVNPSGNFILLSRKGKQADTVFLNEQGRFGGYLENIKPGFYLFSHPPEQQNLYLTPGDSLLLRANTLAFDESLFFSGTGDRENNFLTSLLLGDEQSAEMLLGFYKMPPADFIKKIDSIREERLELLEEEKNFSEDFKNRTREIIRYSIYDLKERYIYLVNKYFEDLAQRIPPDFYDYRNKADFNLELIQETSTYRRFIDNYLTNYALRNGSSSTRNSKEEKSSSYKNILLRIKKADELIHLVDLRESFLKKLGVLGIIAARNTEEIDEVNRLMESLGLGQADLKELQELSRVQRAFLPGTSLNAVEVVTFSGQKVSIGKISNQPTAIFVWSVYSDNHEVYHNLIRDLRKKFPQVYFIAVNIDFGERDKWRKTIRKYGYDQNHEFHLDQQEIDKKIFSYYLNKILFVDSSGKVLGGDCFIHSPDLEQEIRTFMDLKKRS